MAENITLETVIARRADLMTSELSPSELVMLSLENNAYYGMEDTAKAIWDQLGQPRPLSAVVAALQEQFDVDEATCQQDVLEFVKDLLKNGLVVLRE